MAQDVLDEQQNSAADKFSSSLQPKKRDIDSVLKKIEQDTRRVEIRESINTKIENSPNGKNPQEYEQILNKVKATDLPQGLAKPAPKKVPARQTTEQSLGRNQPLRSTALDQDNVPADAQNQPDIGEGYSRQLGPQAARENTVPPRPLSMSSSQTRGNGGQIAPQSTNPQPQIPNVPNEPLQNYLANNQLARSVTTSGIGKQAEKKALGKATSQLWWYGFGAASATFFSGLDFMLGAIVMDVYWMALHRKDKNLFPLKFWQKAVTVFANVAPALYLITIVLLIFITVCNSPAFKLASFFTGEVQYCQYFNIGNIASVITNNPTSSTINPPAGHVGTSACMFTNQGPASVANLSQSCFGPNAPQASAIAVAESGGIATRLSGSDICADGSVASVGLFQINLTNHKIAGLNCPAAFSSQFTASNHSCRVIDQNLYQQCLDAARDPANNIAEACVISRNGASWNQWGANLKCGF